MKYWLWLIAASALGACVPDSGPWMRPGEDCLSCHSANARASKNTWTAGGTVFDSSGNGVVGAQIVIKDATGRAVTLESNGVGNFYTAEVLTEPFESVSVINNGKQLDMPANMPATGACNSCHNPNGAAGRNIVAP